MNNLRTAAQQALEALEDAARCVQENYLPDQLGHDWDEQITTLRAVLAQQAEPVEQTCTWFQDGDSDSGVYGTSWRRTGGGCSGRSLGARPAAAPGWRGGL